MPDNFKRVTTISQNAEIMYLINKSNVRPGELTKDQVKMFEAFVKEYSDKDRATLGNVYAKGYATARLSSTTNCRRLVAKAVRKPSAKRSKA